MRLGRLSWTRRSVVAGACGILALASASCRDSTSALAPSGRPDAGPAAGPYVVGEFLFHDSCVAPVFALTGSRATARTAVITLEPRTDGEGAVALNGSFVVADPTPGAPGISIFEGPDTGSYRIFGDTLRLQFGLRLNAWVGVIPFTLFRGGVLAGASANRCSTLALRLERRP